MELNLVNRLRVMVFTAILGKTGTGPLFNGCEQTRLEPVGQKPLDSITRLLGHRPIPGTTGR